MNKTIGILTAGSDSPGLNAAIRAIGKTARGEFGMHLVGFQDGFQGMAQDLTLPLEGDVLSGILTSGGTILGTSPDTPEHMQVGEGFEDSTAAIIATYRRRKLDALVCLGGAETQRGALHLARQGLNVITLPKGIANALPETDASIGYDTALSAAVEAIDRVHSTASSHHRILLVELSGQYTGWLALGAGVAGGADVILLPEIPYSTQKVSEAILQRSRVGKRFSIVAVADGAMPFEQSEFFARSRQVNETRRSGEERSLIATRLAETERQSTRGNTLLLGNRLESMTHLETRITILGYLLRGGAPSATDRLLATTLGSATAAFIKQGVFGVMIAARNGSAVAVPLEKVVDRFNFLPLDHPWIVSARRMGTCLGD